MDCLESGANILNLSIALVGSSVRRENALADALDRCARQGAIVVAAAGNGGFVGGSAITQHPWVISVAACDLRGRIMRTSNLGASIGRRGLAAPGEGITSLGVDGAHIRMCGTSVAAPFVTGAVALMWSRVLTATAVEVKAAINSASVERRTTIAPPTLDAWGAYRLLTANHVLS